MNAGCEERFIRIDVADAADEGLIQKQRLDVTAMPFEPGEEFFGGNSESVGAGFGEKIGNFGIELHAAELPDVVKDESAVIEFKNRPRVFGALAIPKKLAGHAEVDVEDAAVELYEDLLAMATHAFDSLGSERFRSCG